MYTYAMHNCYIAGSPKHSENIAGESEVRHEHIQL